MGRCKALWARGMRGEAVIFGLVVDEVLGFENVLLRGGFGRLAGFDVAGRLEHDAAKLVVDAEVGGGDEAFGSSARELGKEAMDA